MLGDICLCTYPSKPEDLRRVRFDMADNMRLVIDDRLPYYYYR